MIFKHKSKVGHSDLISIYRMSLWHALIHIHTKYDGSRLQWPHFYMQHCHVLIHIEYNGFGHYNKASSFKKFCKRQNKTILWPFTFKVKATVTSFVYITLLHVVIHIYTKYDCCGPEDNSSSLYKMKLLFWTWHLRSNSQWPFLYIWHSIFQLYCGSQLVEESIVSEENHFVV